MTVPLRIAVLLPELLDSNGDAANGRVLVARARWSGLEADAVALREDDDFAIAPDAVVIGTGADQDLPAALELLRRQRSRLSGWIAEGTRLIAVGTGWELVTDGLDTAAGFVAGAALLPGRAVTGAARATDDIAVQSEAGLLIGFENHARTLSGSPVESALGRVLSGTGNGDGSEGYLREGVLATHLHGPVLAKNPVLADRVLAGIAERNGLAYSARNALAEAADETARAAREVIAKRLGVVRSS